MASLLRYRFAAVVLPLLTGRRRSVEDKRYWTIITDTDCNHSDLITT